MRLALPQARRPRLARRPRGQSLVRGWRWHASNRQPNDPSDERDPDYLSRDGSKTRRGVTELEQIARLAVRQWACPRSRRAPYGTGQATPTPPPGARPRRPPRRTFSARRHIPRKASSTCSIARRHPLRPARHADPARGGMPPPPALGLRPHRRGGVHTRATCPRRFTTRVGVPPSDRWSARSLPRCVPGESALAHVGGIIDACLAWSR